MVFDDLLDVIPNRKVTLLPSHLRQEPPPVWPPQEKQKSPFLPSLSLAQARQHCGLPPGPERDKRAALPYDSKCARDLFMSGRIVAQPGLQRKALAGWSESSLNPEYQLDQAEQREAISEMDYATVQVADTALEAANTDEVGAVLPGGPSVRSRQRRGKAALIEAAARLKEKLDPFDS
jgi:hypothetical protein